MPPKSRQRKKTPFKGFFLFLFPLLAARYSSSCLYVSCPLYSLASRSLRVSLLLIGMSKFEKSSFSLLKLRLLAVRLFLLSNFSPPHCFFLHYSKASLLGKAALRISTSFCKEFLVFFLLVLKKEMDKIIQSYPFPVSTAVFSTIALAFRAGIL